ncbi:hypothetical protein [Nonomuraea aridisoli]|uniref:hypothetical protein n=1 Tax=Nonomuraea aridisoli TaxID=2070368 RepID=UPI0015E8D4D6|nr:hypothetical protein [Nonomuraea aridisoli]
MTTAQQRGSDTATSDGKVPKQYTLDMPMVSVSVHRPDVHMPHVPRPHISKQELGHYADVARTVLPPPDRLAYYGALGAMAAFGAIDWPVAAAIGAGMIIVQRRRDKAPSQEPESAREPEPKKETTTARERGAAGKRKSASPGK